MRVVFAVLGTLAMGLAIAGLFLPLLPTTGFLLIAAACYARASERFYRRLLGNRLFGPMIREWREHRAIPRRSKHVALGLIVVTFAITIGVFLEGVVLRAVVAAVGVGVFVFVSRIPSRNPEPAAPPVRGS